MSKAKKITMFVCSNCGNESAKWEGKCINCGEWNTYSQISIDKTEKKLSLKRQTEPKIKKLSEISSESIYRIGTNFVELDRVLGGGIVPGSLILIGGDPGIGKSTLMLQMAASITNGEVLYVSGEESLNQIKQRSNRLDLKNQELDLLAETSLESIRSVIRKSEHKIVVIDSIQSIYSEKVEATPGNAVQVRECSVELMQIAKEKNISIFIIGHVTKEGFIAGPKMLEHLVDTVLQFEGEKTYSFRILRSLKNRFGSTNEIGIFRMNENGLQEILNPSEIFIAQRSESEPGIAIAAAMEGSRPLLIEIQALVAHSNYGMPQRIVNGYDSRRIQMLIAVLEKRIGLNFRQSDIFVNIAGGLYLNDTSVDLAIAMAIISSFRDEAISASTIFCGEIGLTGEVRKVPKLSQRIKEAEKFGSTSFITANGASEDTSDLGKIIKECKRISQAMEMIFGY